MKQILGLLVLLVLVPSVTTVLAAEQEQALKKIDPNGPEQDNEAEQDNQRQIIAEPVQVKPGELAEQHCIGCIDPDANDEDRPLVIVPKGIGPTRLGPDVCAEPLGCPPPPTNNAVLNREQTQLKK